eukprot:479965-Pleurochrysis_carterae.AAC.2
MKLKDMGVISAWARAVQHSARALKLWFRRSAPNRVLQNLQCTKAECMLISASGGIHLNIRSFWLKGFNFSEHYRVADTPNLRAMLHGVRIHFVSLRELSVDGPARTGYLKLSLQARCAA